MGKKDELVAVVTGGSRGIGKGIPRTGRTRRHGLYRRPHASQRQPDTDIDGYQAEIATGSRWRLYATLKMQTQFINQGKPS
jgi:NAD(P)-dependent dehydrogenase (short-subunit alcohol dehydrogenase family)